MNNTVKAQLTLKDAVRAMPMMYAEAMAAHPDQIRIVDLYNQIRLLEKIAPEMLEMLRGAVSNMDRLADKRSAYREMWIKQAQAAITKAEGQ